MAEEFSGKWDLSESDNFDGYMKAAGVGMITRKVANNLKPQLLIEINDDHWIIKTISSMKNHIIEFHIGKEAEETTADGRKVMSTFTLENCHLHENQKGTNGGKDSTFDRYVHDGKLIIDMECDGVKARRVYQRAQ